MEVIFDQQLFEKKLDEIKVLALSLNESDISNSFSKYPKHIFAPLEDYLEESFVRGMIEEGILGKAKDFGNTFVKKSKEIAARVSDAVKQFSYKKVFATITKMMLKIKAKILKQMMILLEPLREVIINNKFCDENNKFLPKAAFNKLISIAKVTGKDVGAKELLTDDTVKKIASNANLEGTEALTEGTLAIYEDKEVASFDEKDLQYLDFFQKMLYKLGVRDAKLNGFFSTIAKKITQTATVVGFITIIGALLPNVGIMSAIAGAVGGAVAAAPVLVMIIGAILFGIGLFMFATWLLKPYPTIKNCEIFLSTIFDGSNVFDNPEEILADVKAETKPAEEIRREDLKPAFDFEYIQEVGEEGFEEEDDQTQEDREEAEKNIRKTISKYDDLDLDTLENPKTVKEYKKIVRTFVRKVYLVTEDREDEFNEFLDEDIQNYDFDKTPKFIEELLELRDIILFCNMTHDSSKGTEYEITFGLYRESVQDFLSDSSNTLVKRLGKIIDVVDNMIDRMDKMLDKIKEEEKEKSEK